MGLCLVMIKPDAVQKGNVGKIITILEDNEYQILNMKRMTLTMEQAAEFYKEHEGKSFFLRNVSFISSGPVIALIVLHPRKSIDKTILHLRELAGDTNPEKAKEGTIRKMFGTELPKNAVHISDSLESFGREVNIVFLDPII